MSSLKKSFCRSVLMIAILPAFALAAQLPAQFTLGKYIPEGMWLYIHGVDNPDRAWIDREWSEVFQELKASGIDKDILGLIASVMDADTKAQVQAQLDKATKLVGSVNWGELTKNEVVFAERCSADGAGVEYLLMTRGKENSGQANFAGLTGILKEISAMSGKPIADLKINDLEVRSLPLAPPDQKDFPISLELFRKGDVIGFTTDKRLLNDIAALISGKSQKKAFVDGARFQQAMKDIEAPRDAIMYFDARVFVGDMRKMFATIIARKGAAADPTPVGNRDDLKIGPIARASARIEDRPAAPAGGEGEMDEARAAALVGKVFELIDFSEYFVSSMETKGRRELKHSIWKMQEGKQTSPLAGVLFNRKPFEKFDQFIPVDATGFALTDFIDLEKLYNVIIDFVAKEIPGGAAGIEQFKAGMAAIGFDLQRDIFSWWGGEMINVEMPAAFVSPMSGADWVSFIRVKDAEIAAAKVNRGLDSLAAQLKAQKQPLMLTEAKVNSPGFREVAHPYVAMFFKPVIGVHGEWLIMGSSAAAINKCLDVSTGKAPSIVTNARFKDEGIIPKGPVYGVSFRDTSNFGQEMAQGIGMLGMIGPLMLAGMPEDDPDAKQAKKIITSAITILMKLGPVMQKIDFYSSDSSMTTYDGKLTVRHEAVVTYKAPSTPVDEKGAPKPATPPTPPTAPVPPTPPAPKSP